MAGKVIAKLNQKREKSKLYFVGTEGGKLVVKETVKKQYRSKSGGKNVSPFMDGLKKKKSAAKKSASKRKVSKKK